MTGLPFYGHSSWSFVSPGGGYQLRVSIIGDRIVWLQPHGYVRLRNAKSGMALLQDVLFAMVPAGTPFVAIDDYSGVTGASLNARRYIIQALRQEEHLRSYIVFNPSTIFRLGIEFSRRLHIFPFEVSVAKDYADAVLRAQTWAEGLDVQTANSTHPAVPFTIGESEPPAISTLEQNTDPFVSHAAKLLDYAGSINLEAYGVPLTYPQVALEHPFRPLYDAMAFLRDDMQAILRRHSNARENLERRETELANQKTMLDETHTTLHILLANQQEQRRRQEARIRDEFDTLLRPLVERLETVPQTSRQRVLIRLLKDVIGRIGMPLPCETGRLQDRLTPRERMIAYLFSAGQKPMDMAHTLGLSLRTIENHCQRIRWKAGLKGRSPTLQEWLNRKASPGEFETAERS